MSTLQFNDTVVKLQGKLAIYVFFMRPQDLKWPFSEGQREVLLRDSILHIPVDATKQNLDIASLFTERNPIKVEYCSGNGAWIAAKAIQEPNVNWLAVEIKFSRIRRIWAKIKNHQLTNLLGVHAEALHVSRLYFPDEMVSEFFINFPDPWPKRRHAQHRLIQLEFLKEIKRILIPEGTITFVTDDVQYSNWTIETFLASEEFESVYPFPYYVTDRTDYGASYFEELWRLKGRAIRYHQFAKKSQSSC